MPLYPFFLEFFVSADESDKWCYFSIFSPDVKAEPDNIFTDNSQSYDSGYGSQNLIESEDFYDIQELASDNEGSVASSSDSKEGI